MYTGIRVEYKTQLFEMMNVKIHIADIWQGWSKSIYIYLDMLKYDCRRQRKKTIF